MSPFRGTGYKEGPVESKGKKQLPPGLQLLAHKLHERLETGRAREEIEERRLLDAVRRHQGGQVARQRRRIARHVEEARGRTLGEPARHVRPKAAARRIEDDGVVRFRKFTSNSTTAMEQPLSGDSTTYCSNR